MNKYEDKIDKLFCVYGTLRQGQGNWGYLSTAKYVGEFDSNPEYTMYSLSSYPGVIEGGNTSIKMEVYRITDKQTEIRLNQLEGYIADGHENNLYNRKLISTPFGDAYIYLYNNYTKGKIEVTCGDWVAYKKQLMSDIKKLEHVTT